MIRIPGAQVLDLTKSRLRAAGLFSTLANEGYVPLGTVWASKMSGQKPDMRAQSNLLFRLYLNSVYLHPGWLPQQCKVQGRKSSLAWL